jgi:hypothetical protein
MSEELIIALLLFALLLYEWGLLQWGYQKMKKFYYWLCRLLY